MSRAPSREMRQLVAALIATREPLQRRSAESPSNPRLVPSPPGRSAGPARRYRLFFDVATFDRREEDDPVKTIDAGRAALACSNVCSTIMGFQPATRRLRVGTARLLRGEFARNSVGNGSSPRHASTLPRVRFQNFPLRPAPFDRSPPFAGPSFPSDSRHEPDVASRRGFPKTTPVSVSD